MPAMNELSRKASAAKAPYDARRIKVKGRDAWEIVSADGSYRKVVMSSSSSRRAIHKIAEEHADALARLAKK